MKKNNITSIKRIVVSVLPIAALFFTGCGSNIYDSHKDDYTPVTNIESVSFEVQSNWAQKATAISSVKTDDYYDGLFVTKTENSYFLFDMSEALIVCGKTSFDWENDATVENLGAHDINNVWFNSDSKSLEYEYDVKKGVYKMIAEANADYSVTPTQYASFKGYIATIADGEEEWSIFVGAVAEDGLSGNQKDILTHIAKSFTLQEKKEEATAEADEVIPANDAQEDETVEPEISEPEETNTEEVENVQEETLPETVDETSSNDEVIIVDDTEESSSETPVEEAAVEEENAEEPNEEPSEEPSEQAEAVSDEENDTVEESEETQEGPSEDTQEETVEENTDDTEQVSPNDAPTKSTTYSPITVGHVGSLNLADNAGNMTSETVKLEGIITGEEAAEFIKTYGRKKTPSEGTEFVLAKYSASCDPTEKYIDCKFLGVDGENLVHLGVPYSSKCYDIYSKMTEKHGQYNDIYLYYEVPVGTREYLLTFGFKKLKDAGAELETANYIINTGYKAVNPREKR